MTIEFAPQGDSPKLDDPELIRIGREVIKQESMCLEALARRLDHEFARAVRLIDACRGRVFFAGIGKSGIIAKKIAGTLTSIGIPAIFIHPVEALHGDIGMIQEEDMGVLVSYSGETDEMIRLMQWLHRIGIPTIVMSGNPDSTLARYASVHLDISVIREASPGGAIPTSSTTVTAAMGDALAVALMHYRGISDEQFSHYHPGGQLGRKFLRVDQFMHGSEYLPLVKEGSTLREVAEVVSQYGFGCAFVVSESGHLLGIITDGDIRRSLHRGGVPDQTKARDIMTKHPKVISPDALVGDALHLMETCRITVLPVVDDERKPVGLIHLHDLWRTRLF